MKKYLFLFILFTVSLAGVTGVRNVEAQETRLMHIHSGGGILHTIPVLNVDSVTFSMGDINQNTYIANGVSFSMKPVEGGVFTMGCTSEQESDCFSDELPTSRITLSRDYFIGETEVTQALWEAVMGSNPSYFQSSTDPVYSGNRSNYPVERVRWNEIVGTNDAEAGYTINGVTYYKNGFCYKLSQITGGGKQFRLPTEAEWEYAARGGNVAESQTKYSGGEDIYEVAWYVGSIPSGIENTEGYGTQPVKTKQANALGIYDMSGNVHEWCSNWYGDYDGNNRQNPTGPAVGSDRMLRGGGWRALESGCRVSFRYSSSPSDRNYDWGFRLALSSAN
jgi:formylglycine-generating enzyme required for sulfatase activity